MTNSQARNQKKGMRAIYSDDSDMKKQSVGIFSRFEPPLLFPRNTRLLLFLSVSYFPEELSSAGPRTANGTVHRDLGRLGMRVLAPVGTGRSWTLTGACGSGAERSSGADGSRSERASGREASPPLPAPTSEKKEVAERVGDREREERASVRVWRENWGLAGFSTLRSIFSSLPPCP